MKPKHSLYVRRQQGAVTLIITLLIMIAITIGSFAMVQTSMMETRMTANDQRAKEALQSAQAGIDFVLAHLSATPVDNAALCDSEAWDDEFDTNRIRFQLSFLGPDEDGVNFDADENQAFCNSLDFLFIRQIDVWSRGFSRDEESVRTLSSTVDITPPWDMLFSRAGESPFSGAEGPRPPIVARGNIHFQGAPETALCSLDGASQYYCGNLALPGKQQGQIDGILALAGGNITQQGGAGMRMGGENFESGSTDIAAMSDVEFFEQYVSPDLDFDGFRDSKNAFQYQAGNEIPAGTGRIFVDGDLRLTHQVIGSQNNPVTLVIDGDLDIVGNAVIWGVVYATGDADFSRGTSKIMGSLVVKGNVDMRGNAAVYHHPELAGGGQDPDPELVDASEFWSEYAGVRTSSLRIGSWREVLD